MKSWIALCSVASILPWSPAHAQSKTETDTGSRIAVPMRARIPNSGNLSESQRSRKILAEFARCAIDRNYAAVASAVAKPVGAEFHVAVAKVATDDCLASGTIRFKAIAMRGPLFVELYRRRESAKARGRNWGPVTPIIDFSNPSAAVGASDRSHMVLLEIGACTVEKNPGAARAVVLEPTLSDAQDKAFAVVVPSLGPCLPQGQTVTFNKQLIEGMLGEVLYRGVKPAEPTAKVAN